MTDNTQTPSESAHVTPADSIAIDADNIVHGASDLRKAAENTVKQHINAIWQKLEDAAEWPLEKIEALIADLKKHLP